MMFCQLGFLILFIPIAIGINETAPKVDSGHNITITSAPKTLLLKKDNSTTKLITLPVEGGDIVLQPSNPSSLPINDEVILPKMPSEDIGEVSHKNKGKHVVGRTGAPVIVELKNITTKTTPPVGAKKNTSKTTTTVPSPSTKIPHKPTVLRYEEGSSIITNKKPLPGVADGTSTTQPNKPGSHPGMIMPIVITVLVVPLFAVLGYMALKRGQEAWKNRHYKRMDFLLDGMYND